MWGSPDSGHKPTCINTNRTLHVVYSGDACSCLTTRDSSTATFLCSCCRLVHGATATAAKRKHRLCTYVCIQRCGESTHTPNLILLLYLLNGKEIILVFWLSFILIIYFIWINISIILKPQIQSAEKWKLMKETSWQQILWCLTCSVQQRSHTVFSFAKEFYLLKLKHAWVE